MKLWIISCIFLRIVFCWFCFVSHFVSSAALVAFGTSCACHLLAVGARTHNLDSSANRYVEYFKKFYIVFRIILFNIYEDT